MLILRLITKSLGAVQALRGVDFELKSGEVHALPDVNGADKNTLIKVATGAHMPDSDEIIVSGRIVSGLTPALAQELDIACIYQQPALSPDLTVARVRLNGDELGVL